MLIRPLQTSESIKSLASFNQGNRVLNSIFGSETERDSFRELEGRLLILSLINKEEVLAKEKVIHDFYRPLCYKWSYRSWVSCSCNFAVRIRNLDLGIEGENGTRN